MPLETRVPQRQGSSFSMSSPLWAMASFAAARASWVKRSIRRASFLSIKFSGAKSLTSPARLAFIPVVSNRVMGAMPHRPSFTPAQVSATFSPRGVRAPMPVITTRLFSMLILLYTAMPPSTHSTWPVT